MYLSLMWYFYPPTPPATLNSRRGMYSEVLYNLPPPPRDAVTLSPVPHFSPHFFCWILGPPLAAQVIVLPLFRDLAPPSLFGSIHRRPHCRPPPPFCLNGDNVPFGGGGGARILALTAVPPYETKQTTPARMPLLVCGWTPSSVPVPPRHLIALWSIRETTQQRHPFKTVFFCAP